MSSLGLRPAVLPAAAPGEPFTTEALARPHSRRKFRPALMFTGVGLFTLGFNETRVAGWAVSDMIFLLAVGVIVSQLLLSRTNGLAPASMRRSPSLILVGSIGLLTAGTLSTFMSADPATSFQVVLRFAWLSFVWFWALRAVTPDRAALDRILVALQWGALFSSVVAILGYVGLVRDVTNTSGRQSAFFNHANGLAGYLAMCLPLFIVGVPRFLDGRSVPASIRRRVVTSGIVIFGLATTGSMTATLAAFTSTIAIGALLATKGQRRVRQRRPLRSMAILSLAMVGFAALLNSDVQVVERFTLLSEGDAGVTGSAESRSEDAAVALAHLDERLVLGIGFDRQSAAAERGLSTEGYAAGGSGIHNMVLKLYYEGGGLTLLGFVLILVGAIHYGLRLIENLKGDPLQMVAIAMLASVLGLIVLSQFQPMGFERFYWLPIGMITVLWSIRRQETSAPPRSSEPAPAPALAPS